MKVVVILDAVRFDEFKAIIWPEIGGTLQQAQAIDDNTRGVVDKIGEVLKGYPGKVIQRTKNWIIKLVGNIGTLNYRFMFPIKDDLDGCVEAAKKLKKGELLIIHDFYVHNYFKDLPGGKEDLNAENAYPLYQAYVKRMRDFAPMLKEFIDKTKPIPVYVMADHGEAFGEVPGTYCHGEPSRKDGVYDDGVMRVFTLDTRGKNELKPGLAIIEELFE